MTFRRLSPCPESCHVQHAARPAGCCRSGHTRRPGSQAIALSFRSGPRPYREKNHTPHATTTGSTAPAPRTTASHHGRRPACPPGAVSHGLHWQAWTSSIPTAIWMPGNLTPTATRPPQRPAQPASGNWWCPPSPVQDFPGSGPCVSNMAVPWHSACIRCICCNTSPPTSTGSTNGWPASSRVPSAKSDWTFICQSWTRPGRNTC